MKQIKMILLTLCMAILCCGCEDNQPLSYGGMLEDFDYMWTTIQENYALMNLAERKTGKNFQALKDEYRNKITETTTPTQFDAYVSLFLNEFAQIGQMEKLDSYSYKEIYDELSESSASSNAYGYLFDIVDNGKSRTYYDYKNTVLPEESSEHLVKKILEEDNIAYLKLTDMKYTNISDDGKKLNKFFHKIANYNACIIDLRGAKNGVPAYWMENIVSPNIKKKQSYTTISMLKGSMAKDYMQTEYELSEIRKLESLPNLNAKDKEGMTDFVKITHVIEPKQKKPVFKGQFYILVDDSVSGDMESFVMFCKQSGFATIIGHNTGGMGGSLQPLLLKLPNSGIIIRFQADNSLNPDGSSNVEFGTAPDLDAKDQDILTFALEEIHKVYPTPAVEEVSPEA